jgi:hypothetical protein
VNTFFHKFSHSMGKCGRLFTLCMRLIPFLLIGFVLLALPLEGLAVVPDSRIRRGTGRAQYQQSEETVRARLTVSKRSLPYYNIQHGYRFDRPFQWQGRTNIEEGALQSSGFAPYLLDYDERLLKRDPPNEELSVAVYAASGDATLLGIVNSRLLPGTSATSLTLGGAPALRYTSSDGREMVTALRNRKQYDLVLRPATAGDELRNAFERVVTSFEFIDRKLRTY